MQFTLLNGAYSTLAIGATSGATLLTVATGDGALFASASATNPIRCVIVDTSTNPETRKEFVDVTARATDTLTVTRAVEGSTAVALTTGWYIAAAYTAGVVGALATRKRIIDITAAPYNAVADCPLTGATTGATDNTTAIQNAINDINTGGVGGAIYFPKPTNGKCYLVTGNLSIPNVVTASGSNAVTYEFVGEEPPETWLSAPGSGVGTTYDLGPQKSGTVIRFTATTGTAALVAAGPSQSNINVVLGNLVFRCPDNPSITCVDMTQANSFWVEDFLVDTGTNTGSSSQPTHLATFGIKWPFVNNIGPNGGRRWAVEGFDLGFQLSEHCSMDEWLVQKCNIAIGVDDGFHSSDLGHGLVAWCPTVIKALNASRAPALKVSTLDVEETGATSAVWTDPFWHVNDPNNVIKMTGTIHRVTATVGVNTASLRFNGGKYVDLRNSQFAPQTISSSGTQVILLDTHMADRHRITLNGNVQVMLPPPKIGKDVIVELVQDATGSRTVTWFNPGGQVNWASGTVPTLTTTAGAMDRFRFTCSNGTDWDGSTLALDSKIQTTTPAGALAMWLDASTLGLADGTVVGSWTDLSGQGFAATQATGANKPTFHTAVQNSLGAVQFAGSHWLDTPALNVGEAQTFYAVVKQTTNEGIMNQDDGSSVRLWQLRYNTATKVRMIGFSKNLTNVTETETAVITAGAWCVVSAVRQPGSLEVWLNGNSDGASAIANQPISGSTRVRVGTATTTTDNALTGYIGELRIYTGAHTASQNQTIRQALGTKWGIAGVN